MYDRPSTHAEVLARLAGAWPFFGDLLLVLRFVAQALDL